MHQASTNPAETHKAYVYASIFEASIAKWAKDLHHPVAMNFSPSKEERTSVARILKNAALSADLKFANDVDTYRAEHPEATEPYAQHAVAHTLAAGLVLPLPGMGKPGEDYVLVIGVYLEKKNNTTKPLAVAVEDIRMKFLRIQSECAWIVPKAWLSKAPMLRSGLSFEPFDLDSTGKIALRPDEKANIATVFFTVQNGFSLKVLETLEVKHPLLTVLGLTWGFKRLYRPELYFKENQMFPEELLVQHNTGKEDWQARAAIAAKSHSETHFVAAYLIPSLMELTSLLLTLCLAPELKEKHSKPLPTDCETSGPENFLSRFNKNFAALMHILDVSGMQIDELGSTGTRSLLANLVCGIEQGEPVYHLIGVLQKPLENQKDLHGDEIFNPSLNLLRIANASALNSSLSLLPQQQSPLRKRLNKGIKALIHHYSPFFSVLNVDPYPADESQCNPHDSLQGGGHQCLVFDTAYALAQGVNRTSWANDPQLIYKPDGTPASLFDSHTEALQALAAIHEPGDTSQSFVVQSVGIAPVKALLDFVAYSLLPMARAFIAYEKIYQLPKHD